MACKPRGLSKCRVDVWKPQLKDADGVITTPARWVVLETPTNILTNQKRANALVGIDIQDSLYSPRKAKIRITNRCNDYRSVYDDTNSTTQAATTYTHVYNTSDGDTAHSLILQRKWGLYTNFFYPFQYIRVVDTETYLVLFSGRIFKVDKKYEDGAGSVVVLECKDILEEVNLISCKSLVKYATFEAVTTRRSEMIQYGLNLAFNYHADNIKPSGGANRIQKTPSGSTILDSTFNMSTFDQATNSATNSYSRYEQSVATINHPISWLLKDSGAKSLLGELVRFAVTEPHEAATANLQFGYDFFVDSNIGSTNLSAGIAPPASQFNYFKRGNRLAKPTGSSSTQAPETYGLTIHFPIAKSAVAQGHKYGTQVAKKMMHRTFDFDNPNDELFTHCVLTYNAAQDAVEIIEGGDNKNYKREVEAVKKFEVIWVNYLTGLFKYEGLNLDNEWKGADNEANAVDIAELLYAYNAAAQIQNGGNPVCRIQYQSNVGDGNNPTADYHYLLISDLDVLDGFPTENYGSDTYVILKASGTNGSTFQCRFNADESVYPQQGRPYKVWGINKEFSLTKMNITHPDDLRMEVASKLAQASAEMKRGSYQISKAPYYWYDAKVKSVSNVSSPAGQRIDIYNVDDGAKAAIKMTEFGFREGMLVHKMNSDFSDMAQEDDEDVYGYCFNMSDDSHIDVDLSENDDFAADQNIRLFIPIRAGDIIRVDNAIADILGDHIVTETSYNENMGPLTSIESIGANEARKAGAVVRRTFSGSQLGAIQAEAERNNADLGEYLGNQFARSTLVFSAPSSNEVAWAAGEISTINYTVFKVVADSTSDNTYGLGSAGMTGDNVYQLYLDPVGENLSPGASYHIRTILYANYEMDSDHIRIGTTFVGALASMIGDQLTSNADGSPFKTDGTAIIHNASMTSALLKKGAQHWSTDLKFEGTDYNIVRWGHKDNVANNATVSFGDDGTEAITKHTGDTFLAGTSWVYKTVGGAASGTLVRTQTYSDVTRTDTDRILMATVVVASDVGQGSPTIFPINGNIPTISVGAFAARSILATDIKASTITASEISATTIGVDKLTVAAQADITEKTITTVSNSAPTSPAPRTNDIWFDTSGAITVIKVYDGSSWVLRNSNAPEGGTGTTIFYAATSSPPTSNAIRDLWYATDTDIAYIAVTHPANSIETSTEWVKQDVVTAINSASTLISGGLINTAKIILTANGANILETGTGTAPSAARIELSNTEIAGYSTSGEGNKEFYISASNGKAYFAGGTIVLDSTGLVYGSGSSYFKVSATGIQLGHATFGSAPFSVTPAGLLKAESGTIGGWTLASDAMFTGTKTTTGYTSNGGITLTSNGEIHTPTFYVEANGDSAFKGDISAAGGTFTGNVSVASGGAVLGSEGLVITAGTDSTSFLNFKTSGGQTNLKVYASGDDVTLNNQIANGNLKLIASGAIEIGALSLISSGNTYSLGTADDYWGYGFINYIYTDNIRARTGTSILLYPPLLAGAGSDAAPSYSFSSHTNSGLKYNAPVSSYEGVALVGNGYTIATAMSASSSLKYLYMEAHIEMNGYSLLEPGVVRCNAGGTKTAPTFSWMTDYDAGMYHDGSGVLISYGDTERMKFQALEITCYDDFRPSANDTYDLGSYSYKWDDVFATNGTINTSDRRSKTNILPTTLGLSFINDLNPISFKWIGGKNKETHHGLVAQEVIETLTAHGFDHDLDFGCITGSEDTAYGARYTEFVAILIKAVQELSARILVLEGGQ